MSAVEISNVVRQLLHESGAQGWSVEVRDKGGWTVELTHPASHGLVLETGSGSVAEAIERARQWIDSTDEVRVAGSAPVLSHPDLVLELRGLAAAFQWEPHEIAGVVRMLESYEVIASDEANWLAPRDP